MPVLFKWQRHASKCFLIKVQSSILRVCAIKRKDWPNYVYLLITLSWNHREALNLSHCRVHSNDLPHASRLHLYLWLIAPLVSWLLITNTKRRFELDKPRSCSADPRHGGNQSPLHSSTLTLSSFLPFFTSSPFLLLKVASELWILLIHLVRKVRHLSSLNSSQPLPRRRCQGNRTLLYCCVFSLLAFSK